MVSDSDRKVELIRQRNTIKTAIGKIEEWCVQSDVAKDMFDVEANMDLFSGYCTQLETVQWKLEQLDNNEANERHGMDLRITALRARLKRLRFSLSYENMPTPGGSTDPFQGRTQPQVHVISAPSFPFPKLKKFTGEDYLEFPSFINSFTAIANSKEGKAASKIQLFSFLNESLDGTALQAIKHIEVNEANYEVALKVLHERFLKKRLIFESHVKRLFDLPSVTDKMNLRVTLDQINAILNSVEALSATKEEIGFGLLSHFILTKLDFTTLNKWEEKSCSITDRLPSWDELFKFLNERANMLESLAFIHQKDKKPNYQQPRTSYLISTVTCEYCNDGCHAVIDCPVYLQRTPKQRFHLIKGQNRCVRCLEMLPHVEDCSSSRCPVCQGSHHGTLHFPDHKTKPLKAASYTASNGAGTITASTIHQGSHHGTPHFSDYKTKPPSAASYTSSNGAGTKVIRILGTAVIKIKDENGEYVPARMIIDSGSMSHFITKRLAAKLGTKMKKAATPIMTLSGEMKIDQSTKVQIQSSTSEYSEHVELLVLPEINHRHPVQNLDGIHFNIRKDIDLADPYFFKSQQIDGILGVELAYKIQMAGQVKLAENLLLQKTQLGWLVAGAITANELNNQKLTFTATSVSNLDETKNEVERIPVERSVYSSIKQLSENHVTNNTNCDDTRVLSVPLPFVTNPVTLGDPDSMAMNRLNTTERRLATDEIMNRMYKEFLKDNKTLGHMEEVSMEIIKNYNLLSHHGEFNSSTARLKVVFDAPTSNRFSLNDTLLYGRTMQPTLFMILLKIRFFKVALCGSFRCKPLGCSAQRITVFIIAFVCFRSRAALQDVGFGKSTALIRFLKRTGGTQERWFENAIHFNEDNNVVSVESTAAPMSSSLETRIYTRAIKQLMSLPSEEDIQIELESSSVDDWGRDG